MALDREAEALEQFGRARAMRGAIARRVVGRNLHQLREEPRLVVALDGEELLDGAGRGLNHRRDSRQQA